jgi:hypothetical protein
MVGLDLVAQPSRMPLAPGDSVVLRFALTPKNTGNASGAITLRCDDADESSVSLVVNALVVPANQPPSITARVPDRVAVVGTPMIVPVSATDSNSGDVVTLKVVSGPAGAEVVGKSISWTAGPGRLDTTVIYSVCDQYGACARDTFLIDVNHAPKTTSTVDSVVTIAVGQNYSFDVNATDADGDALTYALDSLVGGMAISPTTGLIYLKPVLADTGIHRVVVRVTDAKGTSSILSYRLDIRKHIPSATAAFAQALPSHFALRLSCAGQKLSVHCAVPPHAGSAFAKRHVTVGIYSPSGRLIAEAIDSPMVPGYHTVSLDLGRLARGAAFVRMVADDFCQNSRVVLR